MCSGSDWMRFRASASLARSGRSRRRCVSSTGGESTSARSAPARGLDAELLERARPRIAVGPPALEPRRVPEPPVLHAVERDLAHERRLQINPLRVAAGGPSAGPARPSPSAEALPALEGRQQLPELTTLRGLERRRVTDVVEDAIAVVQTEQEAPDPLPVLRDSVATDDAVRGRAVLHLHPAALTRQV